MWDRRIKPVSIPRLSYKSNPIQRMSMLKLETHLIEFKKPDI